MKNKNMVKVTINGKTSDYELVDMITAQRIVQIEHKINDIISTGGTISDITTELEQYESQIPAFCNFFKAKFYSKNGDYKKACKLISKSCEQVSIDQSNAILIDNLIACIYEAAGEIYANNDEYDKSLSAYQDYMVRITRIKSTDITELLSFRTFNEYSLLDLINEEITVCSPRVMNDPFDTPILRWGENWRKLKADKKHINPLCDSLEAYKIRSFTKVEGHQGEDMVNNVLMWSHYANKHEGFCIRYRFSEEFLTQTEERRTARMLEIKYADKTEPLDITSHTINSDIALKTKSEVWRYENEVRLVDYEPDIEGNVHHIKLDNASRIESIYFGCRCSQRNIDSILHIFETKQDIKFYKMVSPDNDMYNLSAEPLQSIKQ